MEIERYRLNTRGGAYPLHYGFYAELYPDNNGPWCKYEYAEELRKKLKIAKGALEIIIANTNRSDLIKWANEALEKIKER